MCAMYLSDIVHVDVFFPALQSSNSIHVHVQLFYTLLCNSQINRCAVDDPPDALLPKAEGTDGMVVLTGG